MDNKLYTTGEFAKFCDTTKAALFLYDKKGILSPKVCGENGYRYYLSEQIMTFSIIKSLQTSGFSLDEISDVFKSGDPQKFFHLLEENRVILAKKQLELIRAQKFLDEILSSYEQMYYRSGDIHVKFRPTEYFIAEPTGYKTPPETGYFYSWEAVSALRRHLADMGYPKDSFSGDIITEENFKKGEFYPSYYAVKIPGEIPDPLLHVKPSGLYATMLSKGSWDTLFDQYKFFVSRLENHGYKYSGNCYLSSVQFSLLLSSQTSDYLQIFEIKVG